MPFGLKSIWFQLITELAVIALFLVLFRWKYADGAFDGSEGLVELGTTVLSFMLVTVVAIVAVHILGLIVLAIAEGGTEPDTTTDERDRAIEAQGDRVSNTLGGLGFVAGMVLMTFGGSVPVVIATTFVACLAGAVIGNLVKLRAYGEG